MTTAFFRPVQGLSFGRTLTPLQHVIVNRTVSGTMRQPGFGHLEITAPLVALSDGIESAFVLTPREALPKIHVTDHGLHRRHFASGSGLGAEVTGGNSETARQSAALWLAIAQHLEAEEKAAAEEAKKKAAADAKRLDELADEYFDTDDFSDLSTKKQRAVKHIHQLEQELNQEDKARAPITGLFPAPPLSTMARSGTTCSGGSTATTAAKTPEHPTTSAYAKPGNGKSRDLRDLVEVCAHAVG